MQQKAAKIGENHPTQKGGYDRQMGVECQFNHLQQQSKYSHLKYHKYRQIDEEKHPQKHN